MHKDSPRTHKAINAKTDMLHTNYITLSHLRAINLEKRGNKLYVFTVCACRLNYLVRNNIAPCNISISHLSCYSNIYTFSFYMCQFQKLILKINCVLSCSENLSIKFFSLKIIHGEIITNIHSSSIKTPVIFVRFK